MTALGTLPRVIQVASGREWRGGERQVLLLARALRDQGLEQLLVTNGAGRLAAELRGAGIPIRPVAGRPSAFAAIWGEARRQPAILHAHDAHSLTLAGAAARLTGRPLIATRRVDRPLRHRGFWPRADRIVAVSEAVHAVLLADGIDPARIVVIHSGIDLVRARGSPTPEIRAQLGLPATGPLVVTAGALAPEKGQRFLIEAAALLRPSHPAVVWAIAGDGPLRQALERLVADRGLGGVVRFLGELEEPTRLVGAATVFVSSSVQEAFGGAILEAMAVGTPVIATRVGGVPELVGEGAGILVDPANPNQLARAVAELLSDERARRRVTMVATQRVEQFTAEGMAAKVCQVYRSVVIEH